MLWGTMIVVGLTVFCFVPYLIEPFSFKDKTTFFETVIFLVGLILCCFIPFLSN